MSALSKKHIYAGFVHSGGKSKVWGAIGAKPSLAHITKENPELTPDEASVVRQHLHSNPVEGSEHGVNQIKSVLHVVSKDVR